MTTYKAHVGNRLVAKLCLAGDDEMSKRVATEMIVSACREEYAAQKIAPSYYNSLVISVEVIDGETPQ